MTLDEMIERYTRNAEYERTHGNLQGCLEFRQLAEWLKDYKRLLEQEPKAGHWITEIKSDLRGDMWPTNPKCSECGGEPYYSNTIYNYKFCPYCGARMESEDKE